MNDEDEQDPWRLSMTINGGDSWERIDSTLLAIDPNGSVYDILLDQNTEGRFYVSFTGGLYLTEDNGKHFRKIYSGEAGKIWSDNKIPSTIYFNSDKGLLRTLDTLTVSVENKKTTIAKEFTLYQNYPNPFNPSTIIKYTVANSLQPSLSQREGFREGLFISLKVYDILGREVAVLVNEVQEAGSYPVKFNADNLPSGMYFYKISISHHSANRVQSFTDVKKMLLLR